MVIKSNMLAAFTSRQLNINCKSKATATEKLSSGYRVNRAADNAAALSISEKMRAQIRGLNRGAQNVQEGINFCNTAEGALHEVHSILGRIKELSVQAANDTYVTADRISINEEVNMLKEEINRISAQTEFNTYKIFKTYKIFNTPFDVNFSDGIFTVQIFNASNGDPKDPNSYGGIIIESTKYGEDTRVSWDKIDPNMVTKDASGKTLFNAGTYTYDTGLYTLNIECEEGSKPPNIKISFSVSGTDEGIEVAGQVIKWKDILNKDDESILDHIGEAGLYHFNIGDEVGSFYIDSFTSLDDIKNKINECNEKYSRKYVSEYNGYYKAQAIDITDIGSSMRVNQKIAQNLADKTDLDIRLKADESGIWIVNINNDGSDGDELAGSKKTWKDLGITSWDSKNDISDIKVYQYRFKGGTAAKPDYDIQFNFTLLDETSLDSVIAGINNASIVDQSVKTNNRYSFDFTPKDNLVSGTLKTSTCNISIFDEIALGRNFDQQIHKDFSNGKLTYDKDKNQFTLKFDDENGVTVVELNSSSITSTNAIKNNAQAYVDYMVARQIQSIISGKDVTYPNLNDVIGDSNVQTNTAADFSKDSIYATKNMNGTCPVASMDFSGLGNSFQLYDLLGTGFNSTCATCSNHYSVMFVYGDTDKVASNGIGYTMSMDGWSNYTLKIDIKSMMEKNTDSDNSNDISDGSSFTKALIDVMKESKFDFHYQQYAADDGKLYVYDDRSYILGSFDTKPYDIKNCTIDISMNGDKGNLQLQYEYNLKSELSPLTKLVEKENGLFVKTDDGNFKLYNETEDSGKQRYDIELDNSDAAWEKYYDEIMSKIASQSEINLNATNFDYVGYYADELPNSATVSTFDFHIEDNYKDEYGTKKGFWIQAGANTKQGIVLEWNGFTTYTLGIGNDNTLTHESSEKLIGNVDKAVETISYMRSIFGAYTNRMEHMYSIDTNTSENLQSAESKIRDANMADEIVNFTLRDILTQAAQAMLAQANRMQDGMLQLLQ